MMDDRKQRVIIHTDEDEGPSFYGWEVADAAALDALAAHLEKNGVKIARGSRALAEERRVRDLIVFADPVGNRLEAFYGAEIASDPFKPGRSISGFRTGPLGMDLISRYSQGNFHVRGFSGNDKMDHCAQIGEYRDVLKIHVRPRWNSPRGHGD